MSSSAATNANVPAAELALHLVERGEDRVTLVVGEQPDVGRARGRGRASRRCRRATGAGRTAGSPCTPSAPRPGRPRSGRATASCPDISRGAVRLDAGQVAQQCPRDAAPPAGLGRRRTACVSSPATVPSSPSRPLRSSAEATTWAQPGGVRRTTRLPELRPRPPTPPSPGAAGRAERRAPARTRASAYTVVAAGHAHLDRAEVLEVARHRRLRGRDPLAGEQLDQLRLAGDRLLLDQPGDRLLPGLLRASPPRSPTPLRFDVSPPIRTSPRQRHRGAAWQAVVALLEHDARGPSITSAATSSRGRRAGSA